jgi:hypothetical protein
MFGCIAANEKTLPALKNFVYTAGLCVGPDDMYLALRGLRTLGVRLARHYQSGLQVARWFAQRPEVLRVMHPALETDPGHAIWKRDFSGACGLFSIVLKPCAQDAVYAFMNELQLFGMGYSWGGFESLVISFDCTEYRSATPWAPGGPTLRFHIGLEDPGDLIADLAGKRVGTTTDYWKNILRETLAAAGVDPASVTEVDVKPDQMALLYDGTVDAWLGYAQDEPIRATVAGHPVSNLFPADYGIGGYEGLLITLQSTITDSPDLVRRFVRACYEGWRYALEHQDEAAETLDALASENGPEFQRLSVRAVTPLVDTPQAPVGWIDAARWQQLMGETFDPDRPGYTMEFSPAEP